MPDTPPDSTNPFTQMVDELQLQSWLARAEFRHPSLAHPAVREEVDALAQMRDQLRVQLHLGSLEAKDEFHRLEEHWVRLKAAAGETAAEIGSSLQQLVKELREGYDKLNAP